MTVHINGSKGKDLYYGGTKIKEAYYNGNKVYSSGPLYYCYRDAYNGYEYFNTEMNVVGKSAQVRYSNGGMFTPASSESDLNPSGGSVLTVSSLDSNGWYAVSGGYFRRDSTYDLYT